MGTPRMMKRGGGGKVHVNFLICFNIKKWWVVGTAVKEEEGWLEMVARGGGD